MGRALVIASFVGETDDELSVEEGAIVQVLAVEEDGWCRIQHNGHEGLFPPSYLCYEDEAGEPTEPSENPEKSEDASSPLSESAEPLSEREDSAEPSGDDAPHDAPSESEEPPKEETPEEKAIRKEEARRKHRINVIKEIRTTEQDYVNDMEIVVSVFRDPMRQESLLLPGDLTALFSNIEIILSVNQRLNGLLKDSDDNETILVGKIFLEMADFFKMYTEYCANQPKAMDTLERLGKIPTFKTFTDKCMLDERCRGLTLFSFLIKPIQRICKYPLLLRDLLKNTPEDHDDIDNLRKALEEIEKVVAYVNERKRVAENLQKIIDVQNLIESNVELNLVSPSRRFVREGVYTVYEKGSARERKVYLFNDLIVITKPQRNATAKDHFKYQLSLQDAKIIDVADTGTIQNACEIRSKQTDDGRQAEMIVFPTIEEKRSWVSEVKALVKEFQRRQYLESKRLAEEEANAPPPVREEITQTEATKAERKATSKSRRENRLSLKAITPGSGGSTSKSPTPSPGSSPSPLRSSTGRKPVSSLVGSSPFSGWRKKKDEEETPSPEGEKIGKKVEVSKSKAKQMTKGLSGKPPPRPGVKPGSSKSTRAKSTAKASKSSATPPFKPPTGNSEFAAQLAATLKSRQTD